MSRPRRATTDLLVVRCGEPHANTAPLLARLHHLGGRVAVSWQEAQREPVRWEGDRSLDSIRPRPVERVAPLDDLRHRRDFGYRGDRFLWSAFMELYCPRHGFVYGPRWAELLEVAKHPTGTTIKRLAKAIRA